MKIHKYNIEKYPKQNEHFIIGKYYSLYER